MSIKAVKVLADSPEKTKKLADFKAKITTLTKEYNAYKKANPGSDKGSNSKLLNIREDIAKLKREMQKVQRHTA